MTFHVARGDTCVGRFNIEDILARVERGELDPFDHVYDETQGDWVSIIVHPAFAKHQDFWKRYRNINVSKPVKTELVKPRTLPELGDGKEAWFVLKADDRFGPFDYLELVRLLQKNTTQNSEKQTAPSRTGNGLNDWDYVWTKRMAKWARVSSLPEFQPQVIHNLRETLSEKLGGTVNEVFFRRRFARADHSGSILVHDNQNLFKGTSVELGAGGLSLKLAEGDLKVGAHVHVHVQPSN